MSTCGAWCWACNKDDMWDHKSCPDCNEPIAIRHSHKCHCGPEKLSVTRPAPIFCPVCEESKAQGTYPVWYPDYIDWVVCDACLAKEEDDD